YVRAGSAGGDGSEASPFATIAEATASATSGTVIAVAVGEYDEEVALSTGVALVGACASGTIVRFDSARSDRGVINADGADVEIRDLTIGSSARPGLWVVG
ncbi:MAG: DUF1565 domain-containing protein, partial [Actinobacteria bacterium]|nr:DUF1565 domain-containing protein [Actinomycetota bacterium]NIU66224.1 DUF1565 domain-containing protein [Actinomycetota bacterium]NIW28039.1 DUF1565 domain-containing protein [Actinomycetota bacterium]